MFLHIHAISGHPIYLLLTKCWTHLISNLKYKIVVPGGGSTVEFMKQNYPPKFTYQEFAKEFTAEFFNASEWAELFRKSGAR